MKTDIKSKEEILKEHCKFSGESVEVFNKNDMYAAMEAYHNQFSDAPKGAEPMSFEEFVKFMKFEFWDFPQQKRAYDGYLLGLFDGYLHGLSSLSSSEVLTDEMIEKQYPTKVNINNGIYPTLKELNENKLKSEGAKFARDYINNKNK